MLDHLRHDAEPALGVLEIPILNASFDDVEGCGDDQRSTRTSDRGDKILHPACSVVILEFVEILFSGCGATE